MSLNHIRLKQIFDAEDIVVYKVETIDFLASKIWQELGELRIFKIKEDYEFVGSNPAIRNNLLPPKLYQLNKETRKNLMATTYQDYGWGAWSITIHHLANFLIKKNYYPQKYP